MKKKILVSTFALMVVSSLLLSACAFNKMIPDEEVTFADIVLDDDSANKGENDAAKETIITEENITSTEREEASSASSDLNETETSGETSDSTESETTTDSEANSEESNEGVIEEAESTEAETIVINPTEPSTQQPTEAVTQPSKPTEKETEISTETVTKPTESETETQTKPDKEDPTKEVTGGSDKIIFVHEHKWETREEKIRDAYLDKAIIISAVYKCNSCDSIVDESYLECPICEVEDSIIVEDVEKEIFIPRPAKYAIYEYCASCESSRNMEIVERDE